MSTGYEKALQRLIEERKRNNLSQELLSRKLWVTQSQYSKMELGKKRFSYRELQRLIDIGIDVHYIFTGQKETNENYNDFFRQCKGQDQFLLIELLYIVVQCICSKEQSGRYQAICKRIDYMRYLTAGSGKRNIWHLIREYFDYTQKQMAVLLGIDIKKYRRLENKEILPDSEIVFSICEHFQVSPWMILEDWGGLYCEICSILNNLDKKAGDEIYQFLKYGCEMIMK